MRITRLDLLRSSMREKVTGVAKLYDMRSIDSKRLLAASIAERGLSRSEKLALRFDRWWEDIEAPRGAYVERSPGTRSYSGRLTFKLYRRFIVGTAKSVDWSNGHICITGVHESDSIYSIAFVPDLSNRIVSEIQIL